jgi:cardiolipin synthase
MRVRHVLVALGLAAAACAAVPVLEAGRTAPDPRPDGERPTNAQAEKTLDAPLVRGNEGRLLVDGPATHRAMFEAIRRARDHVNLQTYILEAEGPGERLAELLVRKRGEGVTVNVLYDSVGSMKTPPEYFARLRAAGVAVCEFNPVNPLKSPPKGWQINNRDHRKILVVDGRVAFTGGINISGVYSAGSFGSRRAAPPREEGWRDTHVVTRGPIVAEFQRVFFDAWQRQRCDAPARAAYFPPIGARGDWTMRLVASDPEAGESEMYVALHAAIARADRRIWLTYGYFAPDEATIAALQDAAARGVDVRLALPGVSDFWAPLYAGRSHYAGLLATGVRIFERRDALLHAKTAVIDGAWSSVGSTNLDWRSFVHNYEADVIVLGPAFAGELERLFLRDVEASHEISAAAWARRGLAERTREWLARRWEYFL